LHYTKKGIWCKACWKHLPEREEHGKLILFWAEIKGADENARTRIPLWKSDRGKAFRDLCARLTGKYRYLTLTSWRILKNMLTGKVALVTGAGRGIGAEIARALAKEGAAVIVNYCGSKEKAEALAEEIKEAGKLTGVTSPILPPAGK
jgi:3-oxoacyl-ACP reductase-like protein